MNTRKISKRTRHFIIGFLIFAIIVIPLSYLVLNFFSAEETYTSASNTTTSIDSLHCSTNRLDNPFFKINNANSILHEIKITFRDNKPDLISYKLTGTFDDKKTARGQGDSTLSRLWSYLQDHGLAYNYIENSHSVIDNTASIDIIADKEKLNNITASIFSMETAEASKFGDQTMESLKRLYANKGFVCKDN